MQRIWIAFTERQAAELERESKRALVSKSHIVRTALEDRLGLDHELVTVGRPYKSPPPLLTPREENAYTVRREENGLVPVTATPMPEASS
jgi:hypothetical protein